MTKQEFRLKEELTSTDIRIKRFPYLWGGSTKFRKLDSKTKLNYLFNDYSLDLLNFQRFIQFDPKIPARKKDFALCITNPLPEAREAVLVKVDIIFPSGKRELLEYMVPPEDRENSTFIISGFQSAFAGELFVSARIYFSDGSTVTDARITTVLSQNPHQLVITPRVWLVSGRAGRVEYDWDDNEFHCRAYGTITNGSSNSITFRTLKIRVTDGGVDGTLITEFSVGVGPFTVAGGESSNRSINTWYPKGSDVWDKFNKRWDLTVKFTYEADGDIQVSDSAVYRPMSTVPINTIRTTNFTSGQATAQTNALAIATEILEDRDVTLYDSNSRILSNKDDKAKYGMITIDWDGDKRTFTEAHDLYEEISGPEQDRLDMFIPLGFDYTDDVPADKRNVGGFSTSNGPYPKDDDSRRSGIMVLLDESDEEFFGVAMAHEICHYLNIGHEEEEDNLMHKNGGITGHLLTWDQWNIIRQHGMMKWIAADI